MKLPRIGRIDLLLLAVCAGVVLANAWYAFQLTQDSLNNDSLKASLQDQERNVRRLQTIDSVSAPQRELARLQGELSSGLQPVVPATIDELALLFGLLDFLPGSAARIVGLRAQEATTQTIDTEPFRLLDYLITLEGNPLDMLKMVQRVDKNRLASLTIPSLLLTKSEQRWNMEAVVAARLHSASQPAATPTPKPTPSPSAKGTPSPTPARR